jgi:glutaredoxin|nr:MAG TPA: THIOREDOXIN-LIKE PROTEIN-active center, Electron transport.22A [Caudoviricetes sp.]
MAPFEIVIASQPSCQQCRSSKRYLTKNATPYLETKYKDDDTAQAIAAANNYTAAPVCYVLDKRSGDTLAHWAGFNMFKLRQWVNNYKEETGK